MLFNSFIFLFAFLPVVYVVFWSLRRIQSRYIWLTLSGYVFYGYWDARFCFADGVLHARQLLGPASASCDGRTHAGVSCA